MIEQYKTLPNKRRRTKTFTRNGFTQSKDSIIITEANAIARKIPNILYNPLFQ
jgi:hypothetical protein